MPKDTTTTLFKSAVCIVMADQILVMFIFGCNSRRFAAFAQVSEFCVCKGIYTYTRDPPWPSGYDGLLPSVSLQVGVSCGSP